MQTMKLLEHSSVVQFDQKELNPPEMTCLEMSFRDLPGLSEFIALPSVSGKFVLVNMWGQEGQLGNSVLPTD